MFSLPLSLFIFISLLLLHNFIIFPPQCFYFLLYNFYYFPFSTFLFSPPQFYYFPSSFLTSLPHHNINLSPPPPYSFFPPPSQFLLFFSLNLDFPPSPLPPPHLFYVFFHPQIHRPPIDPTSTPHPPNIDPRLNFFFNTAW